MYDEPTAGLDPVASTVVEDLIRSLHVGRDGGDTSKQAGGISAYIVVTHQHSTIRRAVDRRDVAASVAGLWLLTHAGACHTSRIAVRLATALYQD